MPRRKTASPPVKHDEFVFWVREPSIRYGFAIQHMRDETDPYNERLSLNFVVECLAPEKFLGRTTRAQFFHDHDLAHGSEHRLKPFDRPRSVAGVEINKSRFDLGGHLPPEALWQLGHAMAAGTVTSLTAGGIWVGRGRAHLRSLSFHGPDFDPIEYIG